LLAFETFGPINQVGSDFFRALGQRFSLISDDPRETSFRFQCLSVSIQRFNYVCFYNSFGNLPAQFLDQSRRTSSFIVFLDNFSAFGNQV